MGTFWNVAVSHTSAATGTFAADRAAHPTFWTANPTVITRLPVISSFEYVSGNTQRMYAAQATKLFDVTSSTPVLIASGQSSGNWSAAQFSNAAVSALGTNWMIAVNESGADYPLRFNGTSWVTLDGTAGAPAPTDGAAKITGPAGTPVEFGKGLSYVWKYRGRLYFIGAGSMDAWYLPIDSVGGVLAKIPLAGAATLGGKLIAGASWSLDAGDGIDDKNVFITSEGEVLIFTGSQPRRRRQLAAGGALPHIAADGHERAHQRRRRSAAAHRRRHHSVNARRSPRKSASSSLPCSRARSSRCGATA